MTLPIPEGRDLKGAERILCLEVLQLAGSITRAAELLGITALALKRRIVRHQIDWPPVSSSKCRLAASK